MPSISLRGRELPPSPIRKLVPYADQAKSKGVEVIHLNIGQPDIKTPVSAMEAVRNSEIPVLEYSRSDGNTTLREKMCAYYHRHELELSPDQLVVTTGGSEALFFTLGSVLDPGDEVLLPEPFYANYQGFSRAMGIEVVPVPCSIENNFALPPISQMESQIGPNTRAILICNPGNPTGYLYTESEIRALAELALKHDLFLISDEVYREFAYDGRKHTSVMSMPELSRHAILIDSVSKRYSMCGARIGCVASRNPELIQSVMKFAQARLSPPTLAQIASEAALDTPEAYFRDVVEEYTRRRDLLMERLGSIPGVRLSRPSGAFYCIAELPVEDAEDFARWLLSDFSYQGHTVMVAPAAGFYLTPGAGCREVRIAYVLETEKLELASEILRRALIEYNT